MTNVLKIDLKDKKILYELTENARFSYTTIAKNVGLSREMVSYKINRMAKEGIINRFTTSLWRPGIGMKIYYVFFITLQASKKEKKDIIKLLVDNPDILIVSEAEGWFNLYVSFCATDRLHVGELFKFIKKVCNLNHNFEFVMAVKYSYATRLAFLEGEEIVSPKKDYNDAFNKLFLERRKTRNNKMNKLDLIDLEILDILNKNCRESVGNIARKLNISHNVIKNKIMKMIKEGLIYCFNPIIDYTKLGYKEYVLLLRTKNEGVSINNLLNKLSLDKRVYLQVLQVGKWDFMYKLYVKNQEEIKDLLSELLEEYPEEIDKYDLLWITKTHKNISYPEKIEEIYNRAQSSQDNLSY